MRELAIIGYILQVIGVAAAGWGLRDTYVAVVGAPLGHDLWHDLRGLFGKPRPQTWVGTKGSVVVSTSATGSGKAQLPEPADDATIEEQMAYVLRMLTILDKRDDAVRTDLQDEILAESRKLALQIATVDDKIGEVNSDVRSLRVDLFGVNGRGLREAFLGLVVTVLGMLLSAPEAFIG